MDLLLREILYGVLRVAAETPDLTAKLAGLFTARGNQIGTAPLLMTKTEYADRVRYSVRKLDQIIEAGLPTVGKGRALRVPVQDADRWLLAHLSNVPDVDDEVDIEALASVRKRARRRQP